MKLSELIAEIGDKNTEVQFLSSCLHGTQKSLKDGATQVTFVTASVSLIDLLQVDSPKVGLVVWLPRAEFEAIKKRETK